MRTISVRKNVPGTRLRFTSRFTVMAKLLDVRSDQTLDTPTGFDASGSESSASVKPNDPKQPVSFQAAVYLPWKKSHFTCNSKTFGVLGNWH
jgi:hypothetical protein